MLYSIPLFGFGLGILWVARRRAGLDGRVHMHALQDHRDAFLHRPVEDGFDGNTAPEQCSHEGVGVEVAEVLEALASRAPSEIRQQYLDNLRWIRQADENKLVVGSQARILYADAEGRMKIASAFNKAIADGKDRILLTLATGTGMSSFSRATEMAAGRMWKSSMVSLPASASSAANSISSTSPLAGRSRK